MIDDIQKRLLKEIADLDSLPVGAYNIRANGAAAGRHTTANIEIVTKTDRPGIEKTTAALYRRGYPLDEIRTAMKMILEQEENGCDD